MIKILKSTDYENKQKRLTRLRKEQSQITEEIQLIELSLNTEEQSQSIS